MAFNYRVGYTALAKDNLDFLGQTTDSWSLGSTGLSGLRLLGMRQRAVICVYLHLAEIKPGRVAMVAFLRFITQPTDFFSGPHGRSLFPGYELGLPSGEQWDAIPLVAKFQIFVFIGIFESYGVCSSHMHVGRDCGSCNWIAKIAKHFHWMEDFL